MLEAAGLLEDAFREYFELEACYLEALEQGGNLAGRQFGELLTKRQEFCGPSSVLPLSCLQAVPKP